MSAEVFISYAAKDRPRVLDLVDRLRAAGVSVWIDQMGIEGATMWSQEIVFILANMKFCRCAKVRAFPSATIVAKWTSKRNF